MEKHKFMYDGYVRMEPPNLEKNVAAGEANPTDREDDLSSKWSEMKQKSLDNLTLEIMCNKKKYNKILSKTNPILFEERREHYAKIQTYSSRILSLTEQLLGSPDTPITHDIQEVFDPFVNACIRYLERKDYEEKIGSKEEDVLFGNMEEPEEPSVPPLYTSFWGKSIKKLYPPKG